jgi:hypothetical protein
MLAKILQPIAFDRSPRRERRRHVSPLPVSWLKPTKPQPMDWLAAYPCIRMHGAAFEAEFYGDQNRE